jgi:hypothetical protein
MRQLRLALLSCLAVFVLLACKDDAEVILEPGTEIEGSWSLISITGSFNPTVTPFEKGEVTLDFDDTSVTIVNQSDQTELGFEAGEYSYTLSNQDGNQSLRIGDGILNGGFELFTTQFTIDQRAWDGPLYTFERN